MKIDMQSVLTLVDIVIRPDRGNYIVEHEAAGDFYEMTAVSVAAIQRIQEGMALGDIANQLAQKFPEEEADVLAFAEQLLELGLVLEIDGIRVKHQENGVVSNSAVTERSACIGRFFFNRKTVVLYGIIFAVNLCLLLLYPALFPIYDDLFPVHSMLLDSVILLAVSLTVIAIHESGHYLAVRARGLPARIGIGYRLFLVVAETEMTGVWRLPHRQRYVPFLAGMMFDQVLLLAGLAVQLLFPGTDAAAISAVFVMYVLLTTAYQCCFYMKTDLYYVIENFTGTYNLMEDSGAWLKGKLPWIKKTPKSGEKRPQGESRVIRLYALFYLIGLAITVWALVAFILPQMMHAVSHSIEDLHEHSAREAHFWDAVLFLVEAVLMLCLLIIGWTKDVRSRHYNTRSRHHGKDISPD